MAGSGAARRQPAANGPENADQGDIDVLMRRFFEQSRGDGSDAALGEGSARPRRDFDMASELLERASQAFDVLMNRCQRLEGDLDEANGRLAAQAAERAETVEQWKRLASGFKAQLDASEQATEAVKARCAAAEARAATAEQKAAALERTSAQAAAHAAIADNLSTKLHDKVVSAFGIGSRAHPVLEAVATRTVAE